MYSKYKIIKILENCFQNMNQANSCSDRSQILILQFPNLELHRLPHHLCRILPRATETLLQHSTYHVLHRFPYFILTQSTTHYHKFWIYQTICQAKPIKCIMTLLADHNILWIEHVTHQKAESNLDNTIKNNSIFEKKHAGFSTKFSVLFYFYNHTCTYNHPYNIHQNIFSPL